MNRRLLVWGEALLASIAAAYLVYLYPWADLLKPTVTAGGDMASHFYPTWVMHHEFLPRGQITGWTMGNYAGFPLFHFYSTLPFFAIAALGYVFPLEQTFKIVTLLGPTTLPLAAAYLFRCLGYSRAATIMAAGSVVPFLFQQGNSMWGGNIASVLAGEFCHSIGLSLSLVYLGVLHRASLGKASWITAAFWLAATGLSHAFAFIGALWFSLWYLWPRGNSRELARFVVPTLALAALLLCFWGVPLIPRVKFTTEWSVIWRINSWVEIVPELLWPAASLMALNVVLLITRIRSFNREAHGLMLFTFFGSIVLYFIAPSVGFPDIRFVPIGQLFAGFMAVDLLAWVGSRFHYQMLYGTAVLMATLSWSHQNIGYLHSWLTWNYSGYEGKVTWNLFKSINDHARGDVNSPRMVFEHSQHHNRFGSSRAFENLPFFAGRSTLEGVFHQVSPNSPFAFYIQSEASEKTSGPFPQYTYNRLSPEKALPHLRHYNVGTIVAVTQAARKAYDDHPAFTRTFSQGGYAIYDIEGGNSGYVEAVKNEPVLYDGHDYKTTFYRWFKNPELLDVPLVPAEIIGEAESRKYEQRIDHLSADLPRVPYTGDCQVSSHLEQQRITFETTCPGRPHIVKVSYFPRWQASDGSPVHLVSPGFMLVTPTESTFEMVYGRTTLDWVAWGLSLFGLAWALACVLVPGVRTRSVDGLAFITNPIFTAFERYHLALGIVLLLLFASLGAASRFSLRAPDKQYRLGQEAYKERKFEEAIQLFEDWTSTDRETFKQATALYQLGVSHSELKQHAASVQVHERLLFEFPNINYGAGTLYHLAANYSKLGMKEEARDAAQRLVDEHGQGNWAKRLEREQPDIFPGLTEPKTP